MDTLNVAHQAALESDRTLFISVIIFQAGVLLTAIVWAVQKAMGMFSHLTEVVTRNTVAMDNNSHVVAECQTELIKCRQAAQDAA